MIIQQCCSCVEKGKNAYCNNCVKSGDYYDIYKYAEDSNNRFNKGEKIGIIKAYSWHDAIEHIKDSFFHNRNENLNINCEKDFAYLEEKHEPIIGEHRNKVEAPFGVAIYLNTKANGSGSLSSPNFWDLTVTASNNRNDKAELSGSAHIEQQ
jgi:hypothetical protein